METRSRKRAEASSAAPSSPSSAPSSSGPTTRSQKRSRLSASTTAAAAAATTTASSLTVTAAAGASPAAVPTRSRVSRAQQPAAAMEPTTTPVESSSSSRSRRNRAAESSDKGKEKEHEVRVRESNREARERDRDGLGINMEGGRNSTRNDEDDDNDSEEGGGIGAFHQNLTSASSALQGLLRKLGAGLDDLLPSSAMASASSSHQSGRLKKILSGLRADGEEGKQVEALTQLCDMLSIGTEDSLSTFSVDSFVPVLVGLLNHESNADIMLLAARAITHLCDVLPSSCAAVVHYGAVSCFVARLLTIEYMDLAEQSLQALKKISQEHPTACLRAGALMAVLSYLDFFSTGVQRVALSTAANMCKKLPSDAADFVMEAVPLLTNLLQYHDAKVLEHASVCLTRIAEAFASSPEKLDELCNHGLVTQAAELISTSNVGGGQASLSPPTYTGLIRLLSTFASGSPLGSKTLLLLGISSTLKDILLGTGASANASAPALNRPAEQVFEIVNLANELLPPLPHGSISLPVSSNILVKGPLIKKSSTSSSGKHDEANGDGTEMSARERLINDQPNLLQQFGMDLLPILIQTYGSSVNSPVRHKCLSVIAKLMYFSSAEMIQSLLSSTNISSFLAGVLAWKDPHVLVPSLQIAEILMDKLPGTFSKAFIREGVVHAVDQLILAGPSTTTPATPLPAEKDNDAASGASSRSRRYKRRTGNPNLDGSEDSKGPVSANTGSPPSSVEIPSVNSSLRVAVSTCAKAFKDKYFPSNPGATDIGVTDDLLHLKNLCLKLNAGVDDQKVKGKGKCKVSGSHFTELSPEKEEYLINVLTDLLAELSKGDGVSTFEFIGSGVVAALLNYFSCVVLSHSSRLSSGSARLSSGLSALTQPFKLRLCRAQGEKSLRDYSSNIVLIDPLASLASVEAFLWPRVDRGESGQKQSPSAGNSDSGTTPAGAAETSPSTSTPASTARRHSTRSKASVNIGDSSKKEPVQERGTSSSKMKGKAVLKSPQDETKGPHTRNASRRRAVVDKDSQMKPLDGDSSSEDEELEISAVELDDELVIDDGMSDDEDASRKIGLTCHGIKRVLRDDSLPVCMPEKVHDVKLGDAPEDTTVASATNDGDHSHPAPGSSSSRGAGGRASDSADLRTGLSYGSRGAMSFAAAAMAGLGSADARGIRGGRDRQGRLLFGGSNDPARLIFTAGGKQLNRHLTIYQAIQRQLVLDEDEDDRYAASDFVSNSILQGELPCDLEKSNPTYNILALLRVLDGLNQLASRLRAQLVSDNFAEGKITSLDELTASAVKVPTEEFINSKLTPKLTRQMQDALALCSGSLPSWCYQLTKACPFLFPFETRRQYFYSTAFGLSRALYRLQQQQGADGGGAFNEREVRVGRLQRQKVRVSRNRILDSAAKVMEMYSSQKAVLEVEYFGEVGTGLGPTLEFYTLLSHDLQKASLGMWRSNESSSSEKSPMEVDGNEKLVHAPLGLFPRPWSPNANASEGSQLYKAVEYFRLVGRVMAKALQDGRLLDLPFSTAFYKIVLGQDLDLYDILSFDAELGKTLQELDAIVCRKRYLESSGNNDAVTDLRFRGAKIEDLYLDFTLPGYPDYILKTGGDQTVDISNLEDYISLVVDATVRTGITRQMEAFRVGFNQVFDIASLQIFSPLELDYLLCGRRELWEADTLVDHIKFDHGYTAKSPAIINLLEIMGDFTPEQQRAFCQFVTGAPRLPPGGLAVLNPKLTIVRKHSSTATNPPANGTGPSESADDDLPSVMTCANYLKLPPYSTKEIMYKKLVYAINEGQGSFDLS
ncbi:unnamed protein product [Linum tenue]|uniref:HECT-type E3 ubiquitin transferase n=1 Tax=Linum tenue TaxID=586396 RepID=A0AAV0LL02_9ROSI|nr:unnamed protein product [Linum tenue]